MFGPLALKTSNSILKMQYLSLVLVIYFQKVHSPIVSDSQFELPVGEIAEKKLPST